ncbi:MAG TPA: hypothetical protein VF978_02315 [Gemmatimonadales bacterium]
MTAPSNPGGPQNRPADLQFDKAEQTDASCVVCSQLIAGTYFEINGQVTCPRCRTTVVAQFNAGTSPGRFARAVTLGLLAAGAGFGIYYAIAKFTGMEFSIIAIVVGVMVGAAVKRGSNGRGGRRYQLLAVFLTYAAIVSTYVPFAFAQAREASQTAVDSAAVASTKDTVALATTSTPADTAEISGGEALTALVMFAGIVLALPFLAGFENILGLVIIGIGLYAAWTTVGRTVLKITGPYRVAATPAS